MRRGLSYLLMAFADEGGAADVDIMGRPVVGRTPLIGTVKDWFDLVAMGLVAGEGGKLLLTDEGHAEAARLKQGQVRHAI